ncbi:hypothetical protein Vafri_12506 [Volvox africanus]|uniref:Phosphoglycerate mutase-like protein n=1 Tax=Volvox africanus TaxID=51714 RepID=A0A8J4BAC7_9CHLO|nr:hypothetical protein Vafri_12506 [Volvox africanus]
MFTPLCARYVPTTRTSVPVWRGLTKLSTGGSFALLVAIIDETCQPERQHLLAWTAVSAHAVVSSHASLDGSAPAGRAYRSVDHSVMAAAAISTLRSPPSHWLAHSKLPAWRHTAHIPLHQEHQPPCGRSGGAWSQRWLLSTPHSLTDDDERYGPLPVPRSLAPRPLVQSAPHMNLEVGTSPMPPTQSKVLARLIKRDARHYFRNAVRQPGWLIGPDRCGQRVTGGRGCDSHGGGGAMASAAASIASLAGRQHISFCRSCTTGPEDGSCNDGDGICGGSGEVGGRRSPERVVSEHLGRQRSATPGQLDPVGVGDSSQQPGASTRHDETHGSLPSLDALRPPPIGSADPSGGARTSLSSETASGDDVNGGGDRSAVPYWVGQTVWAVPCSTVGYGTRAEVVARLPASIMLLRHAECLRLDELQAHERVPNHDIPLSEVGVRQARVLGQRLRPVLEAAGMHLYIYTSPFLRCSETARLLAEELEEGGLVSGVQEAVQLREQDWGNFQDPRVQAECKAERLRYGRFYYRFPSGESVADVYDRLTMFQDHLVRDMCAGRFAEETCVAIVSHGLTLRVFTMRWLHWTVRQFLQVYNIPNAEPVLLHKEVHPSYLEGNNANLPFLPHHTKCLYRLTPRALELLRGADRSMTTSNGCWHARDLVRSQQAALDTEEYDRLWADVDGMV